MAYPEKAMQDVRNSESYDISAFHFSSNLKHKTSKIKNSLKADPLRLNFQALAKGIELLHQVQ